METPHLRIALTTNSLVQLDANFVAARQIVFYDVSPDASEFVDVIDFRPGAAGRAGKGPGGGRGCDMQEIDADTASAGHDPLAERLGVLQGCSVLLTLGLSDLAAVRIQNLRVFPVKSEQVRDIDDVIGALQRMMNNTPPLWLRRVMRDADGNRLSLEDQAI